MNIICLLGADFMKGLMSGLGLVSKILGLNMDTILYWLK